MTMKNALIKIAYKQIIDSNSKREFERDVFNDSYLEFCMQVQSFAKSKEFTSWKDIRTDLKANSNVQYKTGFSIGLYVKKLNNFIPGLSNSLGEQIIPFESHRFEIIESDTLKKELHCVGITYLSDVFTFLGMMGEYMLLAVGDHSENSGASLTTFLLKNQPNLAVVSYRELIEEKRLFSETC